MPSQARDNSWSCDYCGTEGFRSFDDVKDHEQECQESARKRPRSGSPGDQYATGAAEMGGEYASSRSKPLRRFIIMAPDDMHQHQLDMADVLACQNIEVFEAGPEFGGDSPRERSAVPGQVGIRCVACAQQPTDDYNMYFPCGIEELRSAIQMVGDRHVVQCPAAPIQLREEFQHAIEKRRRDREQTRSARDEERSQMAMAAFCSMFCRNCGIVDKYPPQSGMIFLEAEQQQLYAPTPHHPRGANVSVPFPPSSGSRQPFPSMMTPMGDSIASTPLARSSKDQQDRGPQQNYEGGFPGFPTPYASGQRGMYQQGMGAQTPHMRPDTGPGGPTPQQQGHPQDSPFPGYAMSPYDMPPPPLDEFPYFQDSATTWSCRYCSHAPPQYRDHGSTWNGSEHPPGGFIGQHLQVCRSYYHAMSSPPQGMYQGPPPPPGYGFQPAPSSYSGPSPPQGQQPPPMSYYSTGPSGSDPNFSYPQPPSHPGEPRQEMPSRPEGPPMPQLHDSRGRAAAPMPSRPGSVTDIAAQQAIDYLVAAEQDMYRLNPELADIEQLVLDEDKMLLTDYFFYLMKQLRVCRFAEADRKTRGGKRENIAVGYGGLQCIHCADAQNARKFFWSNVDRLANSFAEIPAHVLKCRRCPNQTKTAILDLKARHPEQMAKLPRGSQKVFFRRMWRRLHDSDPKHEDDASESKESGSEKPVVEIPTPSSHAEERSSPSSHQVERSASASSPGTSTEESALLFERPTEEAAKALAASLTNSNPPSPSSRVLLGIPEDKEWLSDMDCFIRRNLEVFCATAEDVDLAQQDRKYPITAGQVGIRCVHCALAGGRNACRGNAVAYPYSISGIYEGVREFERLHLGSCKHLPTAMKQKLDGFKGSSSLSSVLRKYYVLAANALGMYDSPDGIRSGGESVPLGPSVAFAFTEGPSVSEAMRKETGGGPPADYIETGPAMTPLESRKRRQPGRESGDPPADAKPSAAEKSKDPQTKV